MINGRKTEVPKEELTFDDLVGLAFEDPPTGPFICFTITYRRGRGGRRGGSLVEGESIKPRRGMIFNVSFTDKS